MRHHQLRLVHHVGAPEKQVQVARSRLVPLATRASQRAFDTLQDAQKLARFAAALHLEDGVGVIAARCAAPRLRLIETGAAQNAEAAGAKFAQRRRETCGSVAEIRTEADVRVFNRPADGASPPLPHS